MTLLRGAADLISERSNELAALMSMEVGKNRLEALGDVEESADLIRYYCIQLESHDGFSFAMDTIAEHETRGASCACMGSGSHQPVQLPDGPAAGPAGGALAAGNTVVLAEPTGLFSAAKLYECLRDAGLPAGVLHVVPGRRGRSGAGVEPGRRRVDVHRVPCRHGLITSELCDQLPQASCLEMGGKNPTIVSRKADLDLAAAGIVRSAFVSPARSSACSRVYVQRDLYEPCSALTERATALVVGDPTERSVFVGPVIDDAAR